MYEPAFLSEIKLAPERPVFSKTGLKKISFHSKRLPETGLKKIPFQLLSKTLRLKKKGVRHTWYDIQKQ